MKREIKFRAWDKENKKMAQVSRIDFGPGGIKYLIDDSVLLEYTGLHDKNGREIYEGDVVKNEYGKVMEVQYDPRSAAFGVGDYYFGTIGSGKTLEVIGNIFENTEMLEEEQ